MKINTQNKNLKTNKYLKKKMIKKLDVDELPFLEISKDHYIFLEFSMILAISISPFILWITRDGLISIVLYIGLVEIFLSFCYASFLFKGKRVWEYFFTGELSMRKNQFYIGIIIGLIGFGIHFFLFWLIFEVYIDKSMIAMPLDFKNELECCLFFLLFVTFHPIFEEIFWRVFITKAFPRKQALYILNSFHYGLLHLIILLQITDIPEAIIGGIYFVILGEFLIYIKRMIRLPMTIFIHSMINLGISIALYEFYAPYVLSNEIRNNQD